MHAIEIRNYGYAISLLQAWLKDFPQFFEAGGGCASGNHLLQRKENFLSGLSTASLKARA